MQLEAGMREAARRTMGLDGFADDARKAIVTNPDYFVWWYTTKSIALCVAVAGLTFMMGRASCKR